jgi:hypothetical protein
VVKEMNSDFVKTLEVMAYLIVGTVGIALFAGWLLKRFGPRK